MPDDPRNILNGREIPSELYADQPYLIHTDDGAWLCVMTTGSGREGAPGQHVVTIRSTDQGRTWEPPVDVEPADGPEASYAVLLKTPAGRVYCFYNHNTDNVRQVIADNPPYSDGFCRRVDSLGYFVFKYSDDHGRSWSSQRYPIDVREMEIDRQNPYGGSLRFFWNVGKPFIHEGAAYVSLHKVGGFGAGFFTRSEGVLLRSQNLLTEWDPGKVTWETLPEGDAGLRTPPGGGWVAEEQSYSVLSDGSFFAVYRTIDGHPVCAYSRDAGRTWSTPEIMRYADGRPMKHPRAANFCWRLQNGRYLYWFHNHGGRLIPMYDPTGYNDRNPVWICAGEEVDAADGKRIAWSQPEVLLYDEDPYIRMSYPDLIEDDGRVFITETNKDVARVHGIPADLLETLWQQGQADSVTDDGLVFVQPLPGAPLPTEHSAPHLPDFTARDAARPDYGEKNLETGFTIDLWLRLDSLRDGQTVLDNRSADGRGFCLRVAGGAVEIALNDGRTENRWSCDPGALQTGRRHHVGVIVDAGPRLILFVVDGKLHDGGEHRQFGWGRFSPHLRGVEGGPMVRLAPDLEGELVVVRIYDRALRVSEVIANHRSGE